MEYAAYHVDNKQNVCVNMHTVTEHDFANFVNNCVYS
jgi:hypothetical protein